MAKERLNDLDVVLNSAEAVADAMVCDLSSKRPMSRAIRALAFRREDVRHRLMWWNYTSLAHRYTLERWATQAGYRPMWTGDATAASNKVARWEAL